MCDSLSSTCRRMTRAQVLISHLADIEAKLASIHVCVIECRLTCRFVLLGPSLFPALTEDQVPPSSFVSRPDASAAETGLSSSERGLSSIVSAAETGLSSATPATALTALLQMPAGSLERVPPAAPIIESAAVQIQPPFGSDGPVAVALAAARESRHRRAAAVAAATAAAAASLANASQANRPSAAPIDVRSSHPAGLSSNGELSASQETSIRTEVELVSAVGSVFKESVVNAKTALAWPASTGTEGDSDASSHVAAALIDDRSESSSKKAASTLSNRASVVSADVASSVFAGDVSSSAATADGIILWSQMDKDKKVHLNDFLANRFVRFTF